MPCGSAFRGRDAEFLLGLEGNWADAADDAVNMAWGREFTACMEPYSDGSHDVNL